MIKVKKAKGGYRVQTIAQGNNEVLQTSEVLKSVQAVEKHIESMMVNYFSPINYTFKVPAPSEFKNKKNITLYGNVEFVNE